mmetsp:Transcript_29685/g.78743  ORF Transcript_29685/g.78743 Transcript_29685/m.78743 type:complete len:312 (+) Transcript_29685:399-1334(+)
MQPVCFLHYRSVSQSMPEDGQLIHTGDLRYFFTCRHHPRVSPRHCFELQTCFFGELTNRKIVPMLACPARRQNTVQQLVPTTLANHRLQAALAEANATSATKTTTRSLLCCATRDTDCHFFLGVEILAERKPQMIREHIHVVVDHVDPIPICPPHVCVPHHESGLTALVQLLLSLATFRNTHRTQTLRVRGFVPANVAVNNTVREHHNFDPRTLVLGPSVQYSRYPLRQTTGASPNNYQHPRRQTRLVTDRPPKEILDNSTNSRPSTLQSTPDPGSHNCRLNSRLVRRFIGSLISSHAGGPMAIDRLRVIR